MKKMIDKVFRDKEGRIVVVQLPNWPLWVVMGFWGIRFVSNSSILEQVSLWGVRLGLGYWAYLEISSGVNLWRRVLGVAVGGYVLWGLMVGK